MSLAVRTEFTIRITCPSCYAHPHKPCVDRDGTVLRYAHLGRVLTVGAYEED